MAGGSGVLRRRGDEEGHFHESLNLAAVFNLPVIFVCENNFYASHMGLAERRRSDNIADSGAAHGVPAVSIDGNDAVAVHEAAVSAVERARAGRTVTSRVPNLPVARTCRGFLGHGRRRQSVPAS